MSPGGNGASTGGAAYHRSVPRDRVPLPDLRRAELADGESIAALVAAAYGHYVERIGRLPLPMRADHLRAIRQHLVWVATEGEVVVGVLELIDAADHLYVENVAVAPDAQGRGIGRALLAHAEAEARRLGYAEIRLSTNERFGENLAMYARHGYVETGRRPVEGTDVVDLAKRLPVAG